jgi:hypothetical protein
MSGFPSFDRLHPGGSTTRRLTGAATPHSIVVADASGGNSNPEDVTPSTSAGQTLIVGVINDPQGDPNNGNAFPVGAEVSVAERGKVPVLIVSGSVLTKRCTLIASGTPGMAKVLAGEPKPYDVIGYYDDAPQTLIANTALSVELNVHRIEL